MNNVSFNSFLKSFEIGGVKLPSVSKIVSYGTPPPGMWIIPYAERGTRIHELCDEYVSDTMLLPPDEELKQDFDNFVKALKQLGIKPADLTIKDHTFHPTYLYQGIPDDYSKRIKVMIDIKTGKFNKKFERKNVMQLCGYTEMIEPDSLGIHKDWKLFNIYTKGDEPDIREYKFDPDIFIEFLGNLKLMRGEG